jgi:hypothetical protein
MKHLFILSVMVSAFMFGIAQPQSSAAVNCSSCSSLGDCRNSTGGDGSCSRSCSDGVCVCIVVENPKC